MSIAVKEKRDPRVPPSTDTCAWCGNWQRPKSMRRAIVNEICHAPLHTINDEKEPICEICYERHCIRKDIPYVSIVHLRNGMSD